MGKQLIFSFVFILIFCLACNDSDESIIEPIDKKDPYPSELENRYIVLFLTNTSVNQADSENSGKDANTDYTFVTELPRIFGTVKKDSRYKYAFGLPGPMLITQSTEQMAYQINKAFDIAEKYNIPVYFQMDDCNNYTTEFGSDATPKFYENPEWSEWASFPNDNEQWGGESNGRLPYYWFNWGAWMHAKAFPCFQSNGFRNFISNQLENGVIQPLTERYEKLREEGREYLFAGISVGWETHIPDYSENNTILSVDSNNPPVDILTNSRMEQWEISKYGYNSLHNLGYETYNLDVLYQVIHDYTEFIAKSINSAGIPKHKIFTHIVGFMSADRDLKTTFSPPIWTAVNEYSTPGFTLSPITCPYNLDSLCYDISLADERHEYFACAEGYSRGVDATYAQANEYFESMFEHGASLVTVYGWGREPSTSQFAVSHKTTSPFVLAIKKWFEYR